MITIKTEDGNVEVDERDILLIASGIPAAFNSIVLCKQGKDIFSTSSVYSIKASLENRKGIYLKEEIRTFGVAFFVRTTPFDTDEKIVPEEIVPRGTMDSGSRVEHPNYYKLSNGIEVLDVIRAGKKKEAGLSDKQKQIEDLEKAKFYIEDAIKQLNKED